MPIGPSTSSGGTGRWRTNRDTDAGVQPDQRRGEGGTEPRQREAAVEQGGRDERRLDEVRSPAAHDGHEHEPVSRWDTSAGSTVWTGEVPRALGTGSAAWRPTNPAPRFSYGDTGGRSNAS